MAGPRSCLGLHAPHDLLRLVDQPVQFGVGADVEVAEPGEELGQVHHRGIAERLRLAVLGAAEPLTEV
jgi:hypothetical protein